MLSISAKHKIKIGFKEQNAETDGVIYIKAPVMVTLFVHRLLV